MDQAFVLRKRSLFTNGRTPQRKKFWNKGSPRVDVISPYVFILMVEVLLIKINHTANIEGINFAKFEGRSETFADDTTIYITRSEKKPKKLCKIYL